MLIALSTTLPTLFRRHPKTIITSVAILCLGTGLTAFGLAPLASSLGPDASDLPIRRVLESVQTLPTAPQLEALSQFKYSLYRTEQTRSSDTADSLLRRLRIDDSMASELLRNDPIARQVLAGRAGKQVSAEATNTNQLLKLTVRWLDPDNESQFKRLVIERGTDSGAAANLTARIETAPLVSNPQMASGTIRTSLFAATDDAGIADPVASQIAEIFSGDIDFHRALRKGDRFSVVFESLLADGEIMRTGKVLSAEFVNQSKSYQAIWFQENGKKGGYFTPDGQSLQRAFLASPLKFSRVTSGFAMRFHPILQKWRAHLGLDYAAATGTPVRSVGDGVVEFAGMQNGYGNVVIIKHRGNRQTLFAHLSRINVRRGQSVAQGDNIGAVGATGWATGPHLHFEFRVNGKHQDPMLLAKQNESTTLSASALTQFKRVAADMKQQLHVAAALAPAPLP